MLNSFPKCFFKIVFSPILLSIQIVSKSRMIMMIMMIVGVVVVVILLVTGTKCLHSKQFVLKSIANIGHRIGANAKK